MARTRELKLPKAYRQLQSLMLQCEWKMVDDSPDDDFLLFHSPNGAIKVVLHYDPAAVDVHPNGTWKMSLRLKDDTFVVETGYNKIPTMDNPESSAFFGAAAYHMGNMAKSLHLYLRDQE